MSDVLNANGLQTKSLTTLITELTTALQGIYGSDINVDQNSPDGQAINIYSQGGRDLREVLTQTYNSFDPDQATGRVLDQRAAINGVIRQAGTFTRTPVTVTTDRAVNLIGLDAQADQLQPTVSGLFTVRDDEDNQFFLLSSIAIAGAGTQSLEFRSAALGEVEVQLNTITTAVTVIPGVTTINNPSAPTIIGVNEESDTAIRMRRRMAVSLGAVGSVDSIQAALVNVSGVTTSLVLENDTNVTDSQGTPPHTIWAIVEGGTDADIANAIYVQRSVGSGMRGAQVVLVPTVTGESYEVRFDRPGQQDLWIRFSIVDITGATINNDSIRELIVENVFWDIGEAASADTVIAFLKNQNENYRITGAGVSDDNVTFVEFVNPSTFQNRFVNDVTRIIVV